MKINTECEKSDRLTVTKLNNVCKPYKQHYKSKLMTEKYSLLPINPQQLTPLQTLVLIDTLLSVIRKHIPLQSDIDKIVKSIET